MRPGEHAAEFAAAQQHVLRARGIWVAGVGAADEAGEIEYERLAMGGRQPTLATGKRTIQLRPEDRPASR